MAHAAARGIRPTLTSNGTLFTRARARRIVEAGLRGINVSIDSPVATVHDEARGVPGSSASAVLGRRAASTCSTAAGALALTLTQRPPAPVARPVDTRGQEIDLSIARVDDLMARGIVTPEMGARRRQQLERQRAKLKG